MLERGHADAPRVDGRGRGARALRRVPAATTLSLTSLRKTLAYHEDFHKGLGVALKSRW